MKTWRLVLAVAAVFALTASGATIGIPGTVVNGTDVFSGPTITLTSDVALTDLLTLETRGEVFLQSGNTYGTNAAGVLTTAGSHAVGASSPNGLTTYGALLIGNSTYGFHQVYATDAANGLGSGAPPSLLTVSGVTFASLGFTSDMAAGTVLQFLVSDSNTFDNGGAFTVSGRIDTAESTVPEPASLGLLAAGLAGLGLAGRMRR